MDRLQTLLAYYQDDPEDPFTRYALATEYRKRGQDGDALALFEGLTTDHPNYVGTYYHLGKLFEDLGRTPDAIATYQAGIQTAQRLGDLHARAELQSALLEAEGLGFDDD
ncbi:MAG: tetratricopeptide repeat protein [Bacteroidota bacterium]